jgi:molecular chaperone DnaJ
MQISFSPEMLAVTIKDDANTFYRLQNTIERNFSKRIGTKNKTILFKQKDEEVQRRYFLKLIDKIYRKNSDLFDDKVSLDIKKSLDKTIKISHLKSNQLQQQLEIKIDIEDNYTAVFNMGSRNSTLISYLRNYFKDHLIKYRPKNCTLTLYPHSNKTAKLLEKLLNQKEIIGCYVDFIYDIDDFLAYKKTLLKKVKKREKLNALYALLEEFYEVLNCQVDDSFDTIRKKYLQLVKQYHPDTMQQKNPSLASLYCDKFQTIQHAYEMIRIHHKNERCP